MKLLAYFIIPFYTFLFARGYGWLTTNFSVIANSVKGGIGFAIWGILIGLYLYLIHRKLKKVMVLPTGCRILLPVSLILLFCAVTTPYLPNDMPLKASLHILFAFVFGVSILLYFLWIILIEYRQSSNRYRPLFTAILGISVGVLLPLSYSWNCQQRPGNLYDHHHLCFGLPAMGNPAVSCQGCRIDSILKRVSQNPTILRYPLVPEFIRFSSFSFSLACFLFSAHGRCSP